MADTVSALTAGVHSYQYTAEQANAFATDMLQDGIVGSLTNTSGVAPATGAWAVNAQGSPNMTVAVTGGIGYVTATPTSQASQRLRVHLATQNATISANSTGGTRYDWIYIAISASGAAAPAVDGTGVASVTVSRSTSNSVDNGTPPTYGYHIATVTVTNGASSITNGNIADVRASNSVLSSAASISNPYKFSAYNSTTQSLTSGTHKVVFDTEEYDTGNNYDNATNYRFVAPITGYYTFNVSMYLSSASVKVTPYLYVNGSATSPPSRGFGSSSGNASNADITVTGTVDIHLAASDYVEVWANVASSSITMQGIAGVTPVASYFQGRLISAT